MTVWMDVDRACRLTRPDVVRLSQCLRAVCNLRIDPAILHAKHVHLVLRLDRHVHPRPGRVKIEVSRAELFPTVGRDGHFVGQQAALVIEDLQRSGILHLGWRAFVSRVTRIVNRLSGVTRT